MSATDPKIEVDCPKCQAKLSVPAAAMGKSGKCPRCGHVIPLAMPAHGPAAASASAAPSADEPDLGSLGAELDALQRSQPAAGPQPAGWITQPNADDPKAPTIAGSIAAGYMSGAKADYEEQARRHWDYNRALGLDRWGIDVQVFIGFAMMAASILLFALAIFAGRVRWLLTAVILFPAGIFFLVRGIICSFAMRR